MNITTEGRLETRSPDEDDDLDQAYEYAVAMERNLHSIAVDIADWLMEHEYIAVRHTRLWNLLTQYKAACTAAGHESTEDPSVTAFVAEFGARLDALESDEDEIERARRLV